MMVLRLFKEAGIAAAHIVKEFAVFIKWVRSD